jgi:hypothetical protein|tara:strand:+ start:43 stop:291 length:249 start_codon:yes stop_codon:yes gene_type:complete
MRTTEEKFERVKASRNELEAFLRINGISKARFSRILDVCEITADRYIAEPVKLRYIHIKKIANFTNLNTKEIVDLIEYDFES